MANTYSFLDVHCAISGPGGSFSLTGGAAKEGISIERREPKNKLTIGADGSGLHSLRADDSAKAMVRLLKNSPVNALLMGMYNFQKLSSENWGINTISLVSAIGDDLALRFVAFTTLPKVTYDEEGPMNEWEFEAINFDGILAASIQ